MKYSLRYTGEFKRSLKRCLKRGYDEQLLTDVLTILATEGVVYLRNIILTFFTANTKAIGSVTSPPTGFLYGTKTTEIWCC